MLKNLLAGKYSFTFGHFVNSNFKYFAVVKFSVFWYNDKSPVFVTRIRNKDSTGLSLSGLVESGQFMASLLLNRSRNCTINYSG